MIVSDRLPQLIDQWLNFMAVRLVKRPRQSARGIEGLAIVMVVMKEGLKERIAALV